MKNSSHLPPKEETSKHWIHSQTKTATEKTQQQVIETLFTEKNFFVVNANRFEYSVKILKKLTFDYESDDVIFVELQLRPSEKEKFWNFEIMLENLGIRKRWENFEFFGWWIKSIKKTDRNDGGKRMIDTRTGQIFWHNQINSFVYFDDLFSHADIMNEKLYTIILEFLKQEKIKFYNSITHVLYEKF